MYVPWGSRRALSASSPYSGELAAIPYTVVLLASGTFTYG